MDRSAPRAREIVLKLHEAGDAVTRALARQVLEFLGSEAVHEAATVVVPETWLRRTPTAEAPKCTSQNAAQLLRAAIGNLRFAHEEAQR